MAVADILNAEVLGGLQSILGDELYGITQLFAGQLDGEIALIVASCAQGDMVQLSRQAHALKGSCANMGATELARLAAHIEKVALTKGLAAVQNEVQALAPAAQLTLAAMCEAGFLPAGH